MTAIDVAALRRHIGTRIADEDIATEAPLKAIVATFDRQEEAPRQGEPIPPGWHIGYFLSMAPTRVLAADGCRPAPACCLSCRCRAACTPAPASPSTRPSWSATACAARSS
jgi:hypothetical protein